MSVILVYKSCFNSRIFSSQPVKYETLPTGEDCCKTWVVKLFTMAEEVDKLRFWRNLRRKMCIFLLVQRHIVVNSLLFKIFFPEF